jgi:hypothetical protein
MVSAWVAALSAVGGVLITLLVQVFTGHNSNRRSDGLICGQCMAEFIAAGHFILRALPCGDQKSDGDGVGEAFTRLETCYARILLILPALEADLAPVRAKISAYADQAPRSAAMRDSARSAVEALTSDARPKLRIPLAGLRF